MVCMAPVLDVFPRPLVAIAAGKLLFQSMPWLIVVQMYIFLSYDDARKMFNGVEPSSLRNIGVNGSSSAAESCRQRG